MICSETLKQTLQSNQRRPPLVTKDSIYFGKTVIGKPTYDLKPEVLFVFEVMIQRAFRYAGSDQNIVDTGVVVTAFQDQP